MKKLLLYLFLFLVFSQFTSCSWIEGFYITNTSDDPVIIKINLNKVYKSAFPIFDYYDATIYQLDKKNKILYEKVNTVTYDTLERFYHITFIVPPNSAAQIGALHNDTYKSHDQYFINGRYFNLESLTAEQKDKTITVTYESFDRFFIKGKNGVELVIR